LGVLLTLTGLILIGFDDKISGYFSREKKKKKMTVTTAEIINEIPIT
jgi:hypothetical protein